MSVTSISLELSGIEASTKHLTSFQLEDLISNGKIIILNAWIPNFSELKHYLKDSLQNKNTSIEITVINPDCKFATIRGEELEMTVEQVKEEVNHTIYEIYRFYSQLDENEKARVKLYRGDYLPKISIYACNEKAWLGFCWLRKYSIESSYFYINGKDGHLSKDVWDYYNRLRSMRNEVDFSQFEKSNSDCVS